jgi:excisionase family DNA binding protein
MQATVRRTPERETVNIEEVATRLGINRNTAYTLAKQGGLPVPVIQVGRRLVVPRAALDRLLSSEASNGDS